MLVSDIPSATLGDAMSDPERDFDAEPKWPDRTWAVLTILAVGAAILSALWL